MRTKSRAQVVADRLAGNRPKQSPRWKLTPWEVRNTWRGPFHFALRPTVTFNIHSDEPAQTPEEFVARYKAAGGQVT